MMTMKMSLVTSLSTSVFVNELVHSQATEQHQWRHQAKDLDSNTTRHSDILELGRRRYFRSVTQYQYLKIIHRIVYDMPYDSACAYVGVQPLSARRSELGRRFFCSVTISDSCLHDLLPQRRDSEILSRLRRHTAYPIPRTKTNKYRSFIHYALAKYQ